MSDVGIEILRKGLERKERELKRLRGRYERTNYEGPVHLRRKLEAAREAEIRAINRQRELMDLIDEAVNREQTRNADVDRGQVADRINTLESEVEGLRQALSTLSNE